MKDRAGQAATNALAAAQNADVPPRSCASALAHAKIVIAKAGRHQIGF